MQEIPRDKLETMLGKVVHVKWANRACRWTLIEILKDTALLKTTKGKSLYVKLNDLCYTRKHEPK